MHSRICCQWIFRGVCNLKNASLQSTRGTGQWTPVLRGWNELISVRGAQDQGQMSLVLRGCLITPIISRDKRICGWVIEAWYELLHCSCCTPRPPPARFLLPVSILHSLAKGHSIYYSRPLCSKITWTPAFLASPPHTHATSPHTPCSDNLS